MRILTNDGTTLTLKRNKGSPANQLYAECGLIRSEKQERKVKSYICKYVVFIWSSLRNTAHYSFQKNL